MNNLIVFNYEMNSSSKALAFCIDWINHISEHFDRVFVITLRCGEYEVENNVEVICLDSDSKSRIFQVMKLYKELYIIHSKYKISGYFIHMAHKFSPMIFPYKLWYGQKVVMWYAHKSVPMSLKIAEKLVDKIYSVSSESFKLISDKFVPIGHGIDTENRFIPKESFTTNVKNIVVVGRIAKIKNIDMIINQIIDIDNKSIRVHIVGDGISDEDKNYLLRIKNSIPGKLRENFIFYGNVKFDNLTEIYRKMDLALNLSDTGSLDKAIIEPMAMGIPIITSNTSARELFNHLDGKGVYLIDKDQLKEKLTQLITTTLSYNADDLIKEVQINHSLSYLSKVISKEFLDD